MWLNCLLYELNIYPIHTCVLDTYPCNRFTSPLKFSNALLSLGVDGIVSRSPNGLAICQCLDFLIGNHPIDIKLVTMVLMFLSLLYLIDFSFHLATPLSVLDLIH